MEKVTIVETIKWIPFILLILIIVIRGFWPNLFYVDYFTLLALFIACIPFVATYLRRAKILGAEFEFKDEIIETKKLVNNSVERAEEARKVDSKKPTIFTTFRLEIVKTLLESDPVLALAALHIEIEMKLRRAIDFLGLSRSKYRNILGDIKILDEEGIIESDQANALKRIIAMCNKAIHGEPISKVDATEIIEMVNTLNKSFRVGYSLDFNPNQDYEKQGLICEWEHCIENMPLEKKETRLSCPAFSHNCPGGLKKVSICEK